MFTDGFCLCLYGEKAEHNFTVFQIFNVFKAVFHGSFHYLSPYWPQQQAGKKTYCKAGNCHCKSTIMVIRVVEVVELGANPKPSLKASALS